MHQGLPRSKVSPRSNVRCSCPVALSKTPSETRPSRSISNSIELASREVGSSAAMKRNVLIIRCNGVRHVTHDTIGLFPRPAPSEDEYPPQLAQESFGTGLKSGPEMGSNIRHRMKGVPQLILALSLSLGGTLAASDSLSPDAASLKPALQLWLQADGNPWTDGQAIHLWEDRSGRGHDLAATAGARRAGTGAPAKFVARSSIFGFPAVRFEMETGLGGAADNAPEITGDEELTLVLVARVEHDQPGQVGLVAGFGDLAHQGNPGRAHGACIGLQSGRESQPIFVGGWGHDASAVRRPTTPVVGGEPVILTLTKAKGVPAKSAWFFVNGVPVGEMNGSQDLPNFSKRLDLGFYMGHAQKWARGFKGEVAEVVLFGRALRATERSALEMWLSAKYRIPVTTGHPDVGSRSQTKPPASRNHWAFQPVGNPEPPPVDPAIASDHPIDRFVAAEWRRHGLTPVPQADPRTLVRRLYFDLWGMPPTMEQLTRAVSALTPWNDAAWAGLIDELLESPRYGELWGRHWLDVARYADTAGDNADYPVPEARLYRDYVIASFNSDKPYDQFVREQLAGDLLAVEGAPGDRSGKIAATGFMALSRRYATAPYELWHLTLEDTIDTVGRAFMGITMKCARCHDHKSDPVSQRDYYALYGIFESTQFPWAGGEEFSSQKRPREHFIPLLTPEETGIRMADHGKRVQELQDDIAAKERILAEIQKELEVDKAAGATAALLAELKARQEQTGKELGALKESLSTLQEIARRRGFPPNVPIAYAVKEGTPRPAFLQRSGDPAQPGVVVPRRAPIHLAPFALSPIPANESGRRQLGEWLTRPDHPLTARVMVNRIWQNHFGTGIVATASNFGVEGAAPSHLELLDWLARRFMKEEWRSKSLHRLILTSRVWRLASSGHPVNAERDPDNKLIWRHERRRLDAEAIRDAQMSTSGRLDLRRPGEHPFPPIARWGFSQHNQFREFFESNHRSVYLMTTRLQRHPFLALFDGPDTNTTTASRRTSTVPSQALFLMNSPELKREAESFAQRVLAGSPEGRVERSYALAFQRAATPQESLRAREFLDTYRDQGGSDLAAWTAFCRSLLTANEFFHVD